MCSKNGRLRATYFVKLNRVNLIILICSKNTPSNQLMRGYLITLKNMCSTKSSTKKIKRGYLINERRGDCSIRRFPQTNPLSSEFMKYEHQRRLAYLILRRRLVVVGLGRGRPTVFPATHFHLKWGSFGNFQFVVQLISVVVGLRISYTGRPERMSHGKWRETKQQLS